MGLSTPAGWDFLGIVLTIFVAAVHGSTGRGASFPVILCRLPGTALHELAHYLVGFVTGGRPAGFTIIPRKSGSGNTWILGSVTLRNPSMLSSLPSGLAPLLLLPLAWMLFRNWYRWFPRDPVHTLSLYAAVSYCCCSSLPSSHDVRAAFSSLSGIALYAALAAGVFWLYGMK
jgi:hypothetical protein